MCNQQCITVHHVPKCINFHKAITPIFLLQRLSTLCVIYHLGICCIWQYCNIYIHIYVCIYIWTNKLNRYLYILHVFNYSDDVMTSYNFYSNFNILRLLQKVLVNPLQPSVAFLYPLKTFRFSDVFRGYRKAIPGCNELKRHTSSAEN